MNRLSLRRGVKVVLCWGTLLLTLRLIAWAFGLVSVLAAVGFVVLYRSMRQRSRTVRAFVVLSGLATFGLLAEPALDYHRQALPDALGRLQAVTNAPTDKDALLAYARSGRLLRERVYGDATGMDMMRAVRQHGRIPNRLARLTGDPHLETDWDSHDADLNDNLSPHEHYEGFAAGPASAIETLIREDDGTGSPAHLAFLEFSREHYGRLPAELPLDIQDRLADDFLTNHPVGRNLVAFRGAWCRNAARQYASAVQAFALPGEVARRLVPWSAGLAAALVLFGLTVLVRRKLRQGGGPQSAVLAGGLS
jgi:hypothetical protein